MPLNLMALVPSITSYHSHNFFNSLRTFCVGGNLLQNLTLRSFSISEMTQKVASFEDIKALKDCKNTLLIDVREPTELKETGTIPHSINIPLGELENVLKHLSTDEFQKRYGRPKPSIHNPLVFSCLAGIRSAKALQIASQLGYADLLNYAGGWMDWEKHTKQ